MMKREASLHTSSKGNQYKWLEDGYYHEEVAYDEEVENACISENFLGEGEELITIERVLEILRIQYRKYEYFRN